MWTTALTVTAGCNCLAATTTRTEFSMQAVMHAGVIKLSWETGSHCSCLLNSTSQSCCICPAQQTFTDHAAGMTLTCVHFVRVKHGLSAEQTSFLQMRTLTLAMLLLQKTILERHGWLRCSACKTCWDCGQVVHVGVETLGFREYKANDWSRIPQA